MPAPDHRSNDEKLADMIDKFVESSRGFCAAINAVDVVQRIARPDTKAPPVP